MLLTTDVVPKIFPNLNVIGHLPVPAGWGSCLPRLTLFLVILNHTCVLVSCSYSTRCSHPEHEYLPVPPFHSSLYKSSKHFGLSFAFDAPKIWNDLPNDVRCATSIATFRKTSNLTCLQKTLHHSPSLTPMSLW